MGRKYFCIIATIALFAAALTFASCSRAAVTKVSLGQEFSLFIGQNAVITGEDITLKFVDVTSDSRCPQNVTCIRAGEVTCAVEITMNGALLQRLVLIYPGLTSQPSGQDFDGFTIAFRVEPSPIAGKTIARGDYRLVMTMTKNQARYSVPELKYLLLSNFSNYFWCDPDLYPVARPGQEQTNALEQFDAIQADSAEFATILSHLGLADKSQYTDAEKLQIYREQKKLTYAVQLTTSGNNNNFTLRVGSGQGESVSGTITISGAIQITARQPSVNTCPICLASGTLIDTPNGSVAVQNLYKGMAVWTFDASGNRFAATVLQTTSSSVPAVFQLVKVTLADRRSVTASPGHPAIDGKPLGDLRAGDTLDGAVVSVVERVACDGGSTYDLLPSGGTGLYRANGVLLKSTLKAD